MKEAYTCWSNSKNPELRAEYEFKKKSIFIVENLT